MEIEFIEGPNGKDIPAQRVKTVYTLVGDRRLGKLDVDASYYVNHFETCPNASDFSRGKS